MSESVEKNIDELTFREGMDELGNIVAALESNTLELEESLKQYERGIALLRSLKGRLNAAQQKVEVLRGELEQAPSDDQIDTQLNKA